MVDELSFSLVADGYAGQPGNWIESLRAEGQRILDVVHAYVAQHGVQGESVMHESVNDRLPEAVANEALAWPADVIVLGTHGRRGIGRWVMGSGAENILRSAPVPVLLVRLPQAQKKTAEEAAQHVHLSTPTAGSRFEHLE